MSEAMDVAIHRYEVQCPPTSGEVREQYINAIRHESGRMALELMRLQEVPRDQEAEEINFYVRRVMHRDESTEAMTISGSEEQDGGVVNVHVYEDPEIPATANRVVRAEST